jgi:eukaryotic-like serine/threonine-protein kinase
MDESADRWQRIVTWFEAASELPEAQREAWLRTQCVDDQALYDEIRSLLDAAKAEEIATRDAPPDPGLAGRRYGPWEAVRLLGTGGMGSVLLVKRADGQFEQTAALKLVAGHLVGEYFLDRLRSERQILASLRHPNITSLLDGGVTEDGTPYLVMEFVDNGVPLDQYADSRKLTVRERLQVFLKVCAAVEFAHRNLIVHRDLKPGNILVDARGEPILLDFGTARLLPEAGADVTSTLHRFVTPRYASPEALQHGLITTQTDVFSLGVILFELITGSWPFGSVETSQQALKRMQEGLIATPSSCIAAASADARSSSQGQLRRTLSGDLGSILKKAVQGDTERRYSSVAELSEDLRAYLANLPVRAKKGDALYRLSKFLLRNRALAGVAVLAFIALMAAGSYGLWQQHRANLEAERARTVSRFLSGIFALADPNRAGRADMTIKELLETAAQTSDPALARDPATSADVNSILADAFLTQGMFPKSIALQEKALAEAERAHDPARRAVALAGLARQHYETGQTKDVLDLLERALGILREHRRTFTATQQFYVEFAAGGYRLYLRPADSEYIPLLEDAVRLARANRDEVASGSVSLSIATLALAYMAKLRYREAEPLALEAVALDRSTPGHTALLAAHLSTLGRVNRFLGRTADGERFHRESYLLMRKQYGAESAAAANQQSIWAYAMTETGPMEEAARQASEGLRIARKLFPPAYAWTALVTASYTLGLAGNYGEAEALAREGLQALGPNPSPLDSRWHETRGYLGLALVGQHKYDEARPMLEQTVQFYKPSNRTSPYTERLKAALEKTR